ncbi:MAG TPA: hypothetical protein DIU37_01095, partial [Opitutae bacterium]|nr:hypothetical protein [Opitutae bacterium]
QNPRIIDTATTLNPEHPLPLTLQDSDSEDEPGDHVSDGTPHPPINFGGGQFLITGGNPDDDDPHITFIPGGEAPIIYQARGGPPTPPSPGNTPIFAPALERFLRQLAHAFGSHGPYTPFPLLRSLHDIPEEYATNFAETTHEEIAEEIDSGWQRLQGEPYGMGTHTLATNLFENLMQALFYGLQPPSPNNRTTDAMESFIENLHESRERDANDLPDNVIFGHLVLEAALLVQASIPIDEILFPLLSRLSSAEATAENELVRLLSNEDSPSRETIDLALNIALHTIFELRLHLLRLHIDHPSNEEFRNAMLRLRRSGIFDPQANTAESLMRQNGGTELSTEPHIIYMARLFARARHQFIRACLLAWDGHTEDLPITPYTTESHTSAFNLISLYFMHLNRIEPKGPPPTEGRE